MTDRTWKATADQPPRKTLRALMRQLDSETPPKEIARLALIHIPGAGGRSMVESIREDFAEEHELARAQRWLTTQDDPPTVTLSDERRTLPVDTDGEVHPAEVCAVVAHRLGGRAARTCENPGGVIDCAGSDAIGYNCPDCCQQRRREQAIIDEILRLYNRAQMDEARLLPTPAESDADIADDEKTNGASDTADEAETPVVTEGTA
jgi:hypothetical protein